MTRKINLLASSIIVVFVSLAISLHAESVFIKNQSFESLTLGEGQFDLFNVPGWSVSGTISTYNPSPAEYTSSEFPDGNNVIAFNSGFALQTLSITVSPNTIYSLSVDVGNSAIFTLEQYGIQLLANGNILAEDQNSLLPPSGNFLTSVLEYTSLPDDQNIGSNLEIKLFGSGIETHLDNIMLDVQICSDSRTINLCFVLYHYRRSFLSQ